MYKVFAVCALLAAVSAAPADHQATSFASFNDNHNSVHHIQSAPAAPHYAAPAPVHYAAPAPAHYAAPAPAHYAAPAYAAKVVVAAPAAPSYYSAPAPVAKLALPVVAKQVIAAPVAKYASAPAYAQKEEEEYGPAKYEFAYAIQDPHTGDYHSQEEHRDGHHVVGQYSLHEADGTVRIVKYSDEGHGFNAVVERQGHPTEAPAAYKKVVAIAAPQYAHHY